MPRWTVRFFPPPGENHSPEDFIAGIQSKKDQVNITNRLRLLSEMEVHLWPKKWVYKVEGLYQLKHGDYRLYFDTDGTNIIIVCFVCMKKGQKPNPLDLAQARRNLESYYQNKK